MLIALLISYLIRTGKVAAIRNFFVNNKPLTKAAHNNL